MRARVWLRVRESTKEMVALEFTIILPPAVQLECVEQGKESRYPEAIRIEDNLQRGPLRLPVANLQDKNA